jgi:hypothetical protein
LITGTIMPKQTGPGWFSGENQLRPDGIPIHFRNHLRSPFDLRAHAGLIVLLQTPLWCGPKSVYMRIAQMSRWISLNLCIWRTTHF